MKSVFSSFALLLLLAGPVVQAADIEKGKALVGDHCQSCHEDEVYTRPDRKVTSPEGLQKQVQRCELALGLKWFDDQINDTAGYLNDSFYHFQ